jgi:hypothetical protein
MDAEHRGVLVVFRRGGGQRSGVRDRDDIRPGLHGVRHGIRPQEGQPGHHRPDLHWIHRGRQHIGRRGLRRGVHEPGEGLRAGAGELDMEKPLDLLGRTPHWRWPRRGRLRGVFHRSAAHPRTAAHVGDMTEFRSDLFM